MNRLLCIGYVKKVRVLLPPSCRYGGNKIPRGKWLKLLVETEWLYAHRHK